MRGRCARLYYEACIPASLAVLVACHYGVPFSASTEHTASASSYAAGLVVAVLAIAPLLLRISTSPLSSQTAETIVLPGTQAAMYRPEADDGVVWGGLLVPLVLMAMTIDGDDSDAQGLTRHGACTAAIAMSCAFVVSAVNSSLQRARNQKQKQADAQGEWRWMWPVWATIAVGLNLCAQTPVFGSLPLGSLALLGVIAAQHSLTAYIITALSRSFTLGEAAAIAQGTTLVCMDFATSAVARLQCRDLDVQAEYWEPRLEVLCLEAATVGLLLLARASASVFASPKTTKRPHTDKFSDMATFGVIAGLCGFGSLALVAYISHINPVFWVLRLAFGSVPHMLLISYWSSLLVGGGIAYALAVTSRFANSRSKLVLHLRRKSYHLLATLMFVPGYIFAPRLLHVGFTVALVGFVLVECLRVFGIGPWGGPIQDFIRKFTDHRDAGSMVTSHFYLLYGCALPVWLGGSSVVACLSGVLSLGVADAAASLVGMRFGRVRWPGTPKTVEGTAGFVLSLLAATEAVCLLSSSSRPSAASSVGWVEFLALSTISGVLEALTEQNDNLVIPLFMYTATHALVNAGGGVLGIVTLRSALFVAAALAMPHMLLARFTILKSLGISEPAHIL